MKTLVVLAAGRGTRIGRVGDTLHKALVPLDGKAVLSHIFALAPQDCKIVICVGYRADQVREYVRMAHPSLTVTFVDVPRWDKPGAGPGASLLEARDHVEGDMIFTSCDTLWERDATMWNAPYSWAGVAPVPAGTSPTRWCRLAIDKDEVIDVFDKRAGGASDDPAYVGLAHILNEDLVSFWRGVAEAPDRAGELQVSGGFKSMITGGCYLGRWNVVWTDVGDEAAYRRAVAKWSGYDWTKLDEATYVLPDQGRVIKFWADGERIVEKRYKRGLVLKHAVPQPLMRDHTMLSYAYVPGKTGYQAAADNGVDFTNRLLAWRQRHLMRHIPSPAIFDMCMKFYHDKTMQRIELLREPLSYIAHDAVSRLDWDQICTGGYSVYLHGDFNFGNVILSWDDRIYGIDWRQDFAGAPWGDARYDLAKLLAGTVVHWDRARRGDFRPWPEGAEHAAAIRDDATWTPAVDTIAALSLLNSAPLHAAPLDEILVHRGVAWLEETTHG